MNPDQPRPPHLKSFSILFSIHASDGPHEIKTFPEALEQRKKKQCILVHQENLLLVVEYLVQKEKGTCIQEIDPVTESITCSRSTITTFSPSKIEKRKRSAI